MRITQSFSQAQFLASLNTLQANVAQTQNQLSTGQAFSVPADNPAAAGTVVIYNQALAQSQQYTANANSAQTGLNIEGNALSQLQSQLTSLRDLALQANSGIVSSQNLNAIATQAQQLQGSILSLANTQDGNGNYIFGGFATQTQPFTATATGAAYAGDQGQPQVQIAAGQTVAAGDSGDAVFNQIKTGNGTFTVTAGAGNTGTGVVGATTPTVPASYAGGSYSIDFTAPNAYKVLDANNVQVAAGSYTSGQAITFGGVQVSLSGQPATGDTFAVAPSGNQSLFTTIQNLVGAIQKAASSTANSAPLGNAVANGLENIDRALSHLADAQAGVGGRLNLITTQLSVATSTQAQLQKSISGLQGLDYAAAITTLTQQNTTLSAALQSYSLTQGLTLFKYL